MKINHAEENMVNNTGHKFLIYMKLEIMILINISICNFVHRICIGFGPGEPGVKVKPIFI